MREFKEQYLGTKWASPQYLIHYLRVIKSPAEVTLMQKACDISAESFIKVMAASKPCEYT